ncbi:MAG: GTPase obg [Candidatus Shapirobacteria bacterium GW2011_GWE1_38_10]|uniref:GTPase Obg n=1 Tax=Candidatus Shapirobacteria bacterium GW2011_GWE1_38_10 TaxID=1618488 RepID=A0A0G0KKK1_9BACT|nr:MAG: GTPase obg [Candidatus Shapirobacteria bacterium GW2011_GWF2_37_20]KKQ49704.1 MAG: GTPase obg [Candidatus Shapirobacteria bacterium GW2011_GWE1_38_10]KKQ64413.1 MAG: GTPase obg [Candidatus Shapirobacteria bacterium GW2011_GWF1_38_23]HBP50777.1 GTPase ObgE [Candidatus Shapirobacteria bacterium]
MLIDEVNITIQAGNGGNGIVHFYSDGSRPKGGPDGGKGGDGGAIYFKAVSDISRLSQFRYLKKLEAESGENGGPNQKTGKNGRDLIVEVPVGTIVRYDNGTSVEFSKVGETILMAKGGNGGWGNYHFRSSTNITPRQSQKGYKTAVRNVFIQLKLIAEIGLMGLPNAGKTSLLNELTSANARVANYAFTTLEPNLGVTKGGKIIADIPGLIEGASDGKGLGIKFLKHIERTKILVHCLSCESQDPQADYEIVRQEVKNYSSVLAEKPEILILTKSDILEPAQVKKLQKSLNAKLSVSIVDTESLKKLSDLITKSLT